MGELLKGLGNIFGGGEKKPMPMGGTSSLDMLLGQNPGMPMSDNIASIDNYLRSSDPMNAEIPEDVVEGFAPTKRNLLGKIADSILMGYGEKPIYEGRMQERDMKRALKGFVVDPEEAISRLMQVNPELAIPLHNQHTDNVRAEQTAKAMEAYRNGQLEAAELRQILLEQYRDRSLDLSERRLDEQTEYRQNRLGQFDATIEERRRHNQVMENRPTGRGGNSANGGMKQVLRDTRTGEIVGDISPDGTLAVDRRTGAIYETKTGKRRRDLEKE